jgi:hypothetical protein
MIRRTWPAVTRVLQVAALLASGLACGPAAYAQTPACPADLDTRQKFVQDLTGAELGGQIATGSMGSTYVYDRQMACDTDPRGIHNFAVSVIRLYLGTHQYGGTTLIDYMETGLYYIRNVDPRPLLYMNWNYFPFTSGDDYSDRQASIPDRWPMESWMSFNISPHAYPAGGGTIWKFQYSPGESLSNWVTWPQMSGVMPYRVGVPEWEAERTQYSTNQVFFRNLKYRPTSGWFGWTHAGCVSRYGGLDEGWDVVKYSETVQYTRDQPYESGGC